MAAQFHKFQVGNEFTVTFISPHPRGTILQLKRDDPGPLFSLVPADDFEPVDGSNNLPSRVPKVAQEK
jgi:hypothetical protein